MRGHERGCMIVSSTQVKGKQVLVENIGELGDVFGEEACGTSYNKDGATSRDPVVV